MEVEYVPEKAELDEGLDEEFRKIFEKFSFSDINGSEVINHSPVSIFHCGFFVYYWLNGVLVYIQDNDKKDESAENAATTKKADSDSEEEENDNEQREKGISNKKKKVKLFLTSLFCSVLYFNFYYVLPFHNYAKRFMLYSASTAYEDC